MDNDEKRSMSDRQNHQRRLSTNLENFDRAGLNPVGVPSHNLHWPEMQSGKCWANIDDVQVLDRVPLVYYPDILSRLREGVGAHHPRRACADDEDVHVALLDCGDRHGANQLHVHWETSLWGGKEALGYIMNTKCSLIRLTRRPEHWNP